MFMNVCVVSADVFPLFVQLLLVYMVIHLRCLTCYGETGRGLLHGKDNTASNLAFAKILINPEE